MIRKIAGWQFSGTLMICQALTAIAFAAASLVATIAAI
jgi:hypothetical protein